MRSGSLGLDDRLQRMGCEGVANGEDAVAVVRIGDFRYLETEEPMVPLDFSEQ